MQILIGFSGRLLICKSNGRLPRISISILRGWISARRWRSGHHLDRRLGDFQFLKIQPVGQTRATTGVHDRRCARCPPSPGTPGEGRGEGDLERKKSLIRRRGFITDTRVLLRSKSPSPQPSPGIPGEGVARGDGPAGLRRPRSFSDNFHFVPRAAMKYCCRRRG